MNREWRSSNRCPSGTNCVEVRRDLAAVRDSKNADGPSLRDVDVRRLVRYVRAD